VGWLIGPEYIIKPTLAATTRIVFCSNSPLQEAAAAGLEQVQERKFFEQQCAEYAERRDILTKAFDDLGLPYTMPEGSYFVLLVRQSLITSIVSRSYKTFRISQGSSSPTTTPSLKVF